jgi:annexin A7/11
MILNTRSISHLQLVFKEYLKKLGTSMVNVIQKEFSGNLEKALVAVVKSIENPASYFADLFEGAMKGRGTNEEKLIRVSLRCRDRMLMNEVKQCFASQFEVTLARRIQDETSGHFRDLLIAIVGN